MLKSLVVGVNGSDLSQAAARVAVDWARMLGIPVTFLAVLDVEGLTGGTAVGIMGSAFKAERDEKVLADWRARLDAALADAARAAQEAGVEHETRTAEGSPPRELEREAHRHDLVVIGKRAEPRSDHEPPSSESMMEIVRTSPRPVVVAGPTTRPGGSSVVVAYDGSPQASQALESFINSGLFADLPIHLVGVSDRRGEMEARLEGPRDYARRHGREVHLHVLPEGRGVSETLSEFVERESPALLVMGTHANPGLKKLLLGSVSKAVLRTAPVPVFLER